MQVSNFEGGKGKAHVAVIADEGLSIPAKNESARSSAAAPLTGSRGPVHEPTDMVMEGGDRRSDIWVSIEMKHT